MRVHLKRHWMTIVWVALCSWMFYMDYMAYKQEPKYYYLRRMVGMSMYISRGTAAVLNFSCCALVVPMCRALWTTLSNAIKSLQSQCHRGPPDPRPPTIPTLLTVRASRTAKSIHLMIAVTVIVSAGGHTCGHIANAVNFSCYYSNQYPEINAFAYKGQNPFHLFVATVPGLTGIGMIMILSALALTSTKWVRRKNYDIFYYTHYLGFIFFILLIIHPLSGILKEQKNLREHIPGCQMFGNASVEKKEFPESDPGDYVEVTANSPSSRKFRSAIYQSSNYLDKGQEEDSIIGYPEPYPYEVDVNGDLEDEEAERDDVKVYFRRIKCIEVPVFHSIQSKTWMWMSVALMLWTADCIVRWWRRRTDVHIVNVVRHSCDIVQLTLHQSGFSCSPGQYVLIQCPRVSRFEWHPFTVIPPPAEHNTDTFTILMRAQGDWSSQVASLLHPTLKSSQLLQCSSQSNDASDAYFPIVKESSLMKTINSSSNCPLQAHVTHNQYNSKLSKYDSLFTSSGFSNDAHPCIETIKGSNPFIYSLEELENKNFKLFGNSVPVDFRMTNPNSDLLHKNTQILCHSHKLKSNNFSGACSQKYVNKKKNYYKKFVHNIQRHSNDTQTDSLYRATPVPSRWDGKCHSNHTIKQMGKNKEHHTINMDSTCHTRLRVDGPYSSPNEEMLHYPIIIGVAGGVGITPLAATLSHKLCHPVMWPRRIHMVWVVRDARLLLVIAPLLSNLLFLYWQTNMEDCIELRLHVTIPTTQQVLQNLFGSDYPWLLPRISQGRPHWKHLFQEWRQVYTRKEVGVFTCGPHKMCKQVKRHCLQAVSRGCHFNYHQESFS